MDKLKGALVLFLMFKALILDAVIAVFAFSYISTTGWVIYMILTALTFTFYIEFYRQLKIFVFNNIDAVSAILERNKKKTEEEDGTK